MEFIKNFREKINNMRMTTWLIIMVTILGAAVFAVPAIYLHVTDFSQCTVVLAEESIAYTGDKITPEVEVLKNDDPLEEGEDYKVTYKNNEEVGEATVKVEGLGVYRGKITEHFNIVKANQSITGKDYFARKLSVDTFSLKQKAKTKLTYKSSDESIAKVDEKGRITPLSPGTVTITIKTAGNDSYNAAEKKVKVKIKETEAQKRIRGVLAWAKKIADDDSYTYGNGQCPVCHGGAKVYDCIAFAVACYWHGGGIESIRDRCEFHHHIDDARAYMQASSEWKGLGKIDPSELQPGDCMYFYDANKSPKNHGWHHVEIYYGNNQTVGAHNRSTGIGIIPLSQHLHYAEVYRYVGN